MNNSAVVNLVKNYRWRSFFVRYFFLTFIPFLALFMATSIILYFNSANRIQKDAEINARQVLSSVRYSLDNTFQMVNADCSSLLLMYDEMHYILASTNSADLVFAQTVRTMQTNMKAIIGGNDSLLSIYIYCSRSGYVVSSTTLSPSSPLPGFEDTGWFPQDAGDREIRIFRRKLGSGFSNKEVITICKPIFYGSNIDGYFVANIDSPKILQIFDASNTGMSEIYLLDPLKNILLSSGTGIASTRLDFKGLTFPAGAGIPAAVREGSVVTMVSGLTNASLYVVYAYDSSLGKEGMLSPIFFALMIFVLVLAAAAIAFFLTTKFYGVIFSILQIFQGSGRPPNTPGMDNELTFINNNILSVINRNKIIEDELVRNVFTLNLAQAKALQSQLNPHFIFNTIYLISSLEMAEHRRETAVTSALSLLADILRAALDGAEILVPLEREIEYSKKYLAIENLKYRNKLLVEWDIAPETLPLYVLKLSLQPLLENAVSHGLLPLKGERRLKITARAEDGQLFISIHDNGTGIDTKTLAQIKESMDRLALDREKHLGLHNTNQRLKLIFGEKYGCTIDSGRDGTEVTIVLPLLDSLSKKMVFERETQPYFP